MTVPIIAFCAGLLLVVIAIYGGGVELKEFRIPTLTPLSRFLSGTLGAALLLLDTFAPHLLPGGTLPTTPPTVVAQPVAPRPAEGAPTDKAVRTSNNNDDTKKTDKDLQETESKLQAATKELAAAQERESQWQKTVEEYVKLTKKLEQRTKAGDQAAKIEAQSASKLADAKYKLEEARQRADSEKETVKSAQAKVLRSRVDADRIQAQMDVLPKSNPYEAHVPVIGYVMYAVIDNNNAILKRYFDVESESSNISLFPGPNDVLGLTRGQKKIAMRSEPFHWSSKDKYNVTGARASVYLQPGQKVRSAGDVFITTDKDTGNKYAISPIESALNFEFHGNVSDFSIYSKRSGVDGYVYLGQLEADKLTYVKQYFDNVDHPDSVFPAPGDRLRSINGANVRDGPRFWNASTKSYENYQVKMQLDPGQIVSVAGDVVLAKSGISVWVPISLGSTNTSQKH